MSDHPPITCGRMHGDQYISCGEGFGHKGPCKRPRTSEPKAGEIIGDRDFAAEGADDFMAYEASSGPLEGHTIKIKRYNRLGRTILELIGPKAVEIGEFVNLHIVADVIVSVAWRAELVEVALNRVKKADAEHLITRALIAYAKKREGS